MSESTSETATPDPALPDVSSGKAILALNAVRKSFDGQRDVLKSLDMSIEEGDFIGLIGPSGCGKSTILKLIAGLISPTSGAINFTDPEVDQHLSYVFQDATLLPWKTVRDNVSLPLQIKGVDKASRHDQANKFIDLVGLNHAADLYPRELSGGMKMRVSIARALCVEPRLLLLDEPFGALDEMTRDVLNEELLRLRAVAGWTAMFVTHSVAEAVFLSSSVVVLQPDPGAIFEQIDIPLDYPRTAATREDPAFSELVVRVTKALRSVHVKDTEPC